MQSQTWHQPDPLLAADICIHSMEKPNCTETWAPCSLGRRSGKGKIWPISADLEMARVTDLCRPYTLKTSNVITKWGAPLTCLIFKTNINLNATWLLFLKIISVYCWKVAEAVDYPWFLLLTSLFKGRSLRPVMSFLCAVCAISGGPCILDEGCVISLKLLLITDAKHDDLPFCMHMLGGQSASYHETYYYIMEMPNQTAVIRVLRLPKSSRQFEQGRFVLDLTGDSTYSEIITIAWPSPEKKKIQFE